MASGEDAGDPVQRRAVVIAIACRSCASMECHTHAERAGSCPRLGPERVLASQGSGERIRCYAEDGMCAIANSLEDDAVMGGDQRVQDGVVACQGRGHCLWVLVPELGAA